MVTRRTVLAGGAAIGVDAALPSYAVAAGDEKQAFYRSVTRTAFAQTFGTDLDAVRSDAQLKQLIESRGDAYRTNFLAAARSYAEQLPSERAAELHKQLAHRAMRKGGGLHSVLGSDLRRYTHNGRDINSNETNPLFAKIRELREAGHITQNGYRDALDSASDLTHKPGDVWRNFNEQLIRETDPKSRRAELDQGVLQTAAAEATSDRRGFLSRLIPGMNA